MNRIILMILISLLWNQDFSDAVINMNIGKINSYIQNASEKDYNEASVILLDNRGKYAVGVYQIILNEIGKNKAFENVFVKHADKYIMDERIYQFLLNHYSDINNKELIAFILRHNDGKIDYYKWCKIFYQKNILKNIADKSYAFNELDFYSNGIMYAKTGEIKYRDNLIRYDNASIRDLYNRNIFDSNKRKDLLEELLKKGRTGSFEDEILFMALTESNKDYSKYLKKEEKVYYQRMREAIKNNDILEYNYSGDSENIQAIQMASMLYTGNCEGYFVYRSESSEYMAIMEYLDMIRFLFISDISNFKKTASKQIVLENSLLDKMFIIKLILMTEFIDDGTFYRYYLLNNFQQMKPIIDIMAKNSPIALEMNYMFNTKYEYSFENKDSNSILMGILVDIQYNKKNPESLRYFIEKFPGHPILPLLMEII